MANYIAIDGGTTNTRISLVQEYQIIDTIRYEVGARNGIEHKTLLRETLRHGITQILEQNQLTKEAVTCILVSGMLTSEFGIFHLEHVKTPAGAGELHDSMKCVFLKDISDLPIVLIRGVKTDGLSLETADMMRGEETELIGLMCACRTADGSEEADAVYVLPGSHSKLIRTDSKGRITQFSTMLTGEMLAALSGYTILRDAVDLKLAKLDRGYLLKGYGYCKEHGINQAAFKVRVLKNLFSKSVDEVYSFFMGIVLFGEIQEIIKQNPQRVIIGGKAQIKSALYEILKEVSNAEVICVSNEIADTAAARGMVAIYEWQ